MRSVISCLLGALVLTGAGCNRNSIYPVSGKVTYKGSPAAGATLFFYRQGVEPSNESTVILGVVQEDGSFELNCGSLGKGAPPGQYDVVVEWKQASGQNKGRPRHGPDPLKGRYADPKHPLLHATVEAKPNVLPPFELTD